MTKPIVVLTRRLPEAVVRAADERFDVRNNLDDRRFTVAEMQDALRSADGIICTLGDQLGAATFAGGPWRAKILANFGAGIDHIDLAAAKAAGLTVSNTPGVLTEATAELAMALILMVTRRLGEGEREVRAGQWTGWRPTHLLGTSLHRKRLGIIGFGRIGQALARRARYGFGMNILYAGRNEMGVPEKSTTAEGAAKEVEAKAVGLAELLGTSDVVSLHAPATSETFGMLDAGRLGLMKKGSYLINTARGNLVDEVALIEALKSGRLGGAGLDVYAHEPNMAPELLTLENVVTLPHLGSATIETRTAMGMRAIENLDAFFAGRLVLDPVVGP